MPEQQGSGKLRKKKEMTIVIIAALIIVVIASVFVIDYFKKTREEEKVIKEINDSFTEHLDDVRKESESLRETMSHSIPGTYALMGEVNLSDPSRAYSMMQLLPDGTVSAKAFDGSMVSGWWESTVSDSEKSMGIELVAVLFPVDEEPTLYAVWNDSIFEWSSVYFGYVEASQNFESTFISAYDTGKMTIDIFADGKAKAEFIDTNDESENKGLKYAYGGQYVSDGAHIEITLNGATTNFLMFDYGIEGSETDSGIAPVFYKKQ